MSFLINKFIHVSKYTWAIIIAFLSDFFVMEFNLTKISFEGFWIALPLISLIIFLSERLSSLMELNQKKPSKGDVFLRDFCLLLFVFFLATMITLLFENNNSDAKAWWSFILYFYAFYGVIFALFFALISSLFKVQKYYSIIFANTSLPVISTPHVLIANSLPI